MLVFCVKSNEYSLEVHQDSERRTRKRLLGTPKEVDPRAKLLGEHIRSIREREHLTQVEVAERIGVTGGAYQHYEAGRSQPKMVDVPVIAHALGVDPCELFEPFRTAAEGFVPSRVDRMTRNWARELLDERGPDAEIELLRALLERREQEREGR